MLLLTLAGSMSPVKGTVKRGWVEKPSSVLRMSMSSQSLGRTAQSGLGRLTRLKVLLLQSRTVKRSLGNGLPVGSAGPKRTLTPAAATAGSERAAAAMARASVVGEIAAAALRDRRAMGMKAVAMVCPSVIEKGLVSMALRPPGAWWVRSAARAG